MLVDYVKSLFTDLNADSLMIPWIYMCYNKEFTQPIVGDPKNLAAKYQNQQ